MKTKLPADVDQLYGTILTNALSFIRNNNYKNNFDHQRFAADGHQNAENFDVSTRAFYFDWMFLNKDEIYKAYSSLENDDSKILYISLILYRLCSHLAAKIPIRFETEGPLFADYLKVEGDSKRSMLNGSEVSEGIKHYDFFFKNNRYLVDCYGLEYYLYRGQYYYNNKDVKIEPEPNDFVIDGGACLGDTAIVFSNSVGPGGKIFSFEPVADNLKVLQYNANQFPVKNINVLPFGLGDENVDAQPIVLNKFHPGFSMAGNVIPLMRLDDFMIQYQLERLNFIKLDVEGAELEALKGATGSINKFKPKMAISLYHKTNDIFELINYVKHNFPFYKCYIEHYSIHMEETVMYCMA